MDPAAVVAEYMQAKQEHERALAAVEAMRAQLESVRSEYVDARQVELRMEQDVQSTTARVAADLHAMHLHESNERNEETQQSLPPVVDSLVEYHRNIGCYHCYLFVGGDAYDRIDANALRVHVAFPHVKLLHGSFNGADDRVWWATEIERNVDEASCAVEVKGDHVYVRLPVKDGDKEVAGDGFSSFSQIMAKELDKTQYGKLTCRSCDSVLMTTSLIDKVLPLPSANWMDMFDFWGAGIGAFEHLPREDIFAHAGRVYVGEAHILLHEQETVADALEDVDAPVKAQEPGPRDTEEDNDATKDESWQPLRCSQCKAAVGMRHLENRQTIRLEKHLISSSSSTAVGSKIDAKEDIFARYTVDSIVCTELLEFADSDGVFRYTLRAATEATAATAQPPSLQLQLLSWETMIQVKSSAPEFQRVLKVLYSEESTRPVLPVAVPAPASQELLFAPVVCEAIAQRLRKSSALLPKTLQTFNKMNVGYLYA
uniref:HECT domain-containing protein n=1 Tax=Globisporangium ultimum (strain ATCC 200006 / CBS 805.95 / DAOM BR144) TaxID=431595 RepID=K3WSP3_GLOUD